MEIQRQVADDEYEEHDLLEMNMLGHSLDNARGAVGDSKDSHAGCTMGFCPCKAMDVC